ncbi:hypothetical protein AX17_002005 [Amanita inopinata Kibby_2008]|nr:hypothetical protein AX17_002005 [Amanita inopinata Kibby_2008]
MHDRANINVEITVAAFGTGERRKRTKSDKRILEMAAAIKSTFEPVIQSTLYPRSQIDIYLHIIQQDGGILQACVNGATLALISAGIPLVDFACAITCGAHSASPLLDLTLLEENDVPNLTVAILPKTGRVTLVTMETRLYADRFEELFKLALDAGKVIHEEMKVAIDRRSRTLVSAMKVGWPREGGGVLEKDLADEG